MYTLEQVIAFLINGFGPGALIAGVGLGVVLSYRGSGLINLSPGCIAMLSGFMYWVLNTGFWGITIPTVPAVILTLIFALVLGFFFEFVFVRFLRRATPLAKLVASLGFLLSAQAIVIIVFGEEPRIQPSILPSGNFTLFTNVVPSSNLWMFGILLVITFVFAGLYRWSRFGLATRAASENEANATLFGLNPARTSLINTVMMALTMGIVGLLAASIQDVDSQTLPLLIIPALAAAMFGSFTSFSITLVAGVVIGMFESLIALLETYNWYPTAGGPGNQLPGVQELMIFVVLVIAMLLRSKRIPGRGDIIDRRLPAAPRPKAPIKNALKWGALCALALWLLPYSYRGALQYSLISAISLLSLVVIAGYVGQLSVVQISLGGVTGFTISHFFTNLGIGFPWSAIIGIIFAIAVGVVTGFPALRVRGVGLVVVTLAATDAIQNFWFTNSVIGAGITGSPVPEIKVGSFDFGPLASFQGLTGGEPSPDFGWFCLIVLILVSLFVCNLRRSTLGQEMLAVRANERAASATGINIRNVKLFGFAIASGIAGVSGALLAYSQGAIDQNSYGTTVALSLIAFGYIIGITTVPGAIWASIGIPGGLFAICLQNWFGLEGNWLDFIGGFLLVITLISKPGGVALDALYGPPKPPFRESKVGRLIFNRNAPPALGLGSEGTVSIEESTAGATS